MTRTRETLFAIASSWFNRFVKIFLGLALMPLLFSDLGHEELGAWILLAQSSSVLGVLDVGFAATQTRRIALAKGMSGGAPNVCLNDASTRLIANVVLVSRSFKRFPAGENCFQSRIFQKCFHAFGVVSPAVNGILGYTQLIGPMVTNNPSGLIIRASSGTHFHGFLTCSITESERTTLYESCSIKGRLVDSSVELHNDDKAAS